jgi:hypothetical protein
LPLPSTDVRKKAINFQLNSECGTGLYDVGVSDKKEAQEGKEKKCEFGLDHVSFFQLKKATCAIFENIT